MGHGVRCIAARSVRPLVEQLPNYGDERQVAQCAYCGRETRTRDHVPSRVLLDDPYPENLPVVPACRECNEGFSSDEQYTACLIDCALAGSASPTEVGREKIRRILAETPALGARLAAARQEVEGAVQFAVEPDRVRNVVLKLGRGHALFELNELHYGEPSELSIRPLPALSKDMRDRFEQLPAAAVWPEVGSRAMQRLACSLDFSPQWIVVQPGRYRYAAVAGNGVAVRMILSEYLACEVHWS